MRKRFGDEENPNSPGNKAQLRPVYGICLKGAKERKPLELRKIYNYLRTVNFFKDLEKEKLEMLAPQITAKEYNESELCNPALIETYSDEARRRRGFHADHI
jgi:hypothetical protein